jgi:hypothetical protein
MFKVQENNGSGHGRKIQVLKICQENVIISMKEDISMTSALERIHSQSLGEGW